MKDVALSSAAEKIYYKVREMEAYEASFNFRPEIACKTKFIMALRRQVVADGLV